MFGGSMALTSTEPGGFMVCFLCLGAPEVSTGRGPGLIRTRRRGHGLE